MDSAFVGCFMCLLKDCPILPWIIFSIYHRRVSNFTDILSSPSHLETAGFCITYTALLMKTWRVSLTYRVKSAHKVKLTDKQLLQWMVPILLVMGIYLGTWTAAEPPTATEVIAERLKSVNLLNLSNQIEDIEGLFFKQCSYNWWDHAMAIGEVLFLLWGIRVCYNVRNAESLYNEAKLISYAIYNIALVNGLMVAIQ